MKAVACPELNHTDESEQIEARGDEHSDIARMDELEPINDPMNDDLEIRHTDPDGPDVSMLGIDMFWHQFARKQDHMLHILTRRRYTT